MEVLGQRSAFVDAVVKDIQVLAGAAPYASERELIDIFKELPDRIPTPPTESDVMVLRRILADTIRKICHQTGASLPVRPLVDLVADADDPRLQFRAALQAMAQ